MTKKPKLTRKQIAEGLQQMPIETILLGANNTKEKRLTAKQIRFAEEVAKGNTKAEAYRKAYNSKGKPKTQSNEGQKLTKDQAITAQIEAFKVALEAQKYQTPLHLRALTIHKLTEKVLDPNCPPAQQIKAMELLGKITEVALFTERREVIQHNSSDQMKEKLLASLRLAMKSSTAEDVKAKDPESLLAELVAKPIEKDISADLMYQSDANPLADDENTEAEGLSESKSAEPTDPQPPKFQNSHEPLRHSNPHTQSAKNPPSENTPLQVVDSEGVHSVTPVTLGNYPNTEGEGGINIPVGDLESEIRTPPLSKNGSPTEDGGI